MNNWRLLLLAVVVVVQPIGSFTESNLIDGRECCERTQDIRVYGTDRRLLDGNREDRRATNERLKHLDGYRNYEHGSMVRSERLSREPNRYNRDRALRREVTRDIREEQNRNRDVFRSSMVQTERDSRESRSRDALDTQHRFSDARDSRYQQARESMSRLPIRNSRSLENRGTSDRDTVGRRQERVTVIRTGNQRDTRLGRTRSDVRTNQDNREMSDRTTFERRTLEREENRRLLNGDRDNTIRVQRVYENREARERREARDRDFTRAESHEREYSRQRELRSAISSVETRRELTTQRNTEERRLETQNRRDLREESRYANRMERRTGSLDRLLTRFSDRNLRAQSDREGTFNKIRPQMVRSTSVQNDERNRNVRLQESRRSIAREELRKSSEERRNQRENTNVPRDIFARLSRERGDAAKTTLTARKLVRENSEEQRQQRELNRESPVRVEASRNSRMKDSESSDLRRQVLERSMERSIRLSRNAERLQDMRASRSATDLRESVRNNGQQQRRSTKNVEKSAERRNTRESSMQRLESSISRAENSRLERIESRANAREMSIREATETVTIRLTRNAATPERIDHRLIRTESSRVARLGLDRRDSQNERRDVQSERDDTRSGRLSNKRIQEVFRTEKRDTRVYDKSDSRQQRASNRGNERHMERIRVQRELSRQSRDNIRNVVALRNNRNLSERREQSLEDLSRSVRNEARIAETERRNANRITQDAQNARILEARKAIIPRYQENRDASIGENRVDARTIRNERDSERVTERESAKETRNVLRHNRYTDRRESSDIFRTNAAERVEATARTGQRDETIQAKRLDTFRNMNIAAPYVAESDESVFSALKMSLYTLQGIYLCGLVVQMLTQNGETKPKRTFNWWSSPKDLIKAE